MGMKTAVDQMGRTLTVPDAPQRIISLVPSQTELLFDLGVHEALVGVTKFCVHPAGLIKEKQSIGGTKTFRFDVIDALQPDLIIGNKEENYKEGIERLAEVYPVWMSDITTLPDALAMIQAVGALVNRATEAEQMVDTITKRMAHLEPLKRALRTAYFIWQKPYMTAGAGTFIDDLLTRCGLVNVFAQENGRYPQVTFDQIAQADLDLILLSSEPFPFKEKQQMTFQEQFPGVQVELVDGEMFSWYGSRLLLTADYLKNFCLNIGT